MLFSVKDIRVTVKGWEIGKQNKKSVDYLKYLLPAWYVYSEEKVE